MPFGKIGPPGRRMSLNWSELWDKLREIFADTTDQLETILEELKEKVDDELDRVELRHALRAGWDKPARPAISGRREPARGVSIASGTRRHTAATGE